MNKSLRNKAFIYSVFFCVLGFLLALVPVYVVEDNLYTHRLNPRLRGSVNAVLLESFGFFTKSPKEEQFGLMSLNGAGALSTIDLRNNSLENGFGWSRYNRIRLLEISKLIQSVRKDSAWHHSTLNAVYKLPVDSLRVQSKLAVEEFQVLRKGIYLVYRVRPIPWEWSKLDVEQPIKFIICEIE